MIRLFPDISFNIKYIMNEMLPPAESYNSLLLDFYVSNVPRSASKSLPANRKLYVYAILHLRPISHRARKFSRRNEMHALAVLNLVRCSCARAISIGAALA